MILFMVKGFLSSLVDIASSMSLTSNLSFYKSKHLSVLAFFFLGGENISGR